MNFKYLSDILVKKLDFNLFRLFRRLVFDIDYCVLEVANLCSHTEISNLAINRVAHGTFVWVLLSMDTAMSMGSTIVTTNFKCFCMVSSTITYKGHENHL